MSNQVLDFQRINQTIDIDKMNQSHVVIVGGAYGLANSLARCGIGEITLIDFDRIDDSNPARQDLDYADRGYLKIQAAAYQIRRVNPYTKVNCQACDFCSIPRKTFDHLLGAADLFVMATDFFPAQARGNVESLRLGKPGLFIGMYAEGRAGEIIYHIPDGPTKACFRCIASSRYRAFMNQQGGLTIPSTGGTIFDMHLVDAVAGQICVGILTRGSDNRMGRLIDQLGDRNLLQVKIDPTYRLGGKDIFSQYLGDNPAHFSFNTIALSMEPEDDCPDCSEFRKNTTDGPDPNTQAPELRKEISDGEDPS